MIKVSVLQGLSVHVLVLLVFLAARSFGHGEDEARALAVVTLILSNLALILTNRSWTRTIWGILRSPNSALLWVLGGMITFVFLIVYVTFLGKLFPFSILHPIDLLLCALAGAVSIVWLEALKFCRKSNYDNTA